MSVGVVIATYGNQEEWAPRVQRAQQSVMNQTVAPDHIVYKHGTSLAQARNEGAAELPDDFLIFLDADDCLGVRYIETMSRGSAALRQPATLGFYPDGTWDKESVLIPAKRSIREGNWLVIGTMVDAEIFRQAGGFWEEPAWEDWSCWMRCMTLGARWEPISEAIYCVEVRTDSRNNGVAGNVGLFQTILTANDAWAAERGLVIR